MLAYLFSIVLLHRDPPVCRIYIVKGEAKIIRHEVPHTARLVENGFDGDELKTSADTDAEILFLKSGKRFKVMPGTRLRLQDGTFAVVSGKGPVALRSASQSVRTVFTSSTAAAAVRIRGASASLLPTGGLKDAPKEATWQLDQSYDHYRVEVFEDASNKNVFQATVAEKRCVFPSDLFRAGADYRLVVLAQSGESDTYRISRTFRILSESDLATMKGALDELPVPASGDQRTFALVERADIYEQFGCFGEALKCLQDAMKEGSSDSLQAKAEEIGRRATGEE